MWPISMIKRILAFAESLKSVPLNVQINTFEQKVKSAEFQAQIKKVVAEFELEGFVEEADFCPERVLSDYRQQVVWTLKLADSDFVAWVKKHLPREIKFVIGRVFDEGLSGTFFVELAPEIFLTGDGYSHTLSYSGFTPEAEYLPYKKEKSLVFGGLLIFHLNVSEPQTATEVSHEKE